MKTSPRVHKLNNWGSYYDAIKDGRMTFAVQMNVWDFQVGDVLELKRYDPATQSFTFDEFGDHEQVRKRVTYVLHGGQWGVKQGWCVLGLGEV